MILATLSLNDSPWPPLAERVERYFTCHLGAGWRQWPLTAASRYHDKGDGELFEAVYSSDGAIADLTGARRARARDLAGDPARLVFLATGRGRLLFGMGESVVVGARILLEPRAGDRADRWVAAFAALDPADRVEVVPGHWPTAPTLDHAS